jgi:hypothetical protein
LIERQRRQCAVECELDEGSGLSSNVRFRPNPLRFSCVNAPQDDDGLGGAQLLFNYFRIGAMNGERVVTPHAKPRVAQGFRDALSIGFRAAGIRDEHFGHVAGPLDGSAVAPFELDTNSADQ